MVSELITTQDIFSCQCRYYWGDAGAKSILNYNLCGTAEARNSKCGMVITYSMYMGCEISY